jgi:aminoglycoside phosphotransferase (APT) family kinase protein
MSDDVQSRLASYCTRAFPAKQEVRVTELAHISEGWESDMCSFTVESGPAGARQSEELILRIYPGQDAHDKSAREFRGMRLLHGAGYPVPQVLILERENSPFNRPFVIMERIKGQMLWPVLFGSPKEKQQELLTLFCKLFVRLHTLEWRSFVHAQDRPFDQAQDNPSEHYLAIYDAGDPYAPLDRELDKVRPFLTRFPIPGFLPIVAWLDQQRDGVPCQRPSVIHWDYHPGNILLGDDGSATVIDWTQVDVSDSRLDLAWTLLLVSTYEGEVWHKRILHEYERLAGAEVEQLAFFEVVACLKRLYSIAAALTFGPETVGMRPGAEAIMVQQMGASKSVYNLLLERTGIEVPEIEELLAQSS